MTSPAARRVLWMQITWCSSPTLASPLLLLLLLLALLEGVEGNLQDVTVRLHEFRVVLGMDHRRDFLLVADRADEAPAVSWIHGPALLRLLARICATACTQLALIRAARVAAERVGKRQSVLAGRAGAQRFIVICTVPVPRDFSRMREKCVRKASLSNKTMRVLRPLGRKLVAQRRVQTALPPRPGWQTKCK